MSRFDQLLTEANGEDPYRPAGSRPAFASDGRVAPLKVRVLPPSAFADTWKSKPQHPSRIGIRLVGEDVVATAVSMAQETANEYHPHPADTVASELWLESYNAALMINVLAHALCDADDASEPHFKHAPNDTIRIALRDVTIRSLWEDFELLSKQTSPLTPEATDDEIVALGELLSLDGILVDMPAHEVRRVRRLVSVLRSELLGVEQ